MNKEQFSEFHKYLALIQYEYVKMWHSTDLSPSSKKEIGNILQATETLLKVCFIDELLEKENSGK